jgi:hypothetical protein
MIADQSTVNLSFLIFFLNQEQLGSRCQMRTIVQVQPSWVCLVHPGGLRCQLRTIVHAVFRQQDWSGVPGHRLRKANNCSRCSPRLMCCRWSIPRSNWCCWLQGEQLHGPRQAAWPPVIFTPNNCMVLLGCGQGPDPDPEQLFVQAAQSLPGQPESEQLFGLGSGEPGWADPEERTMAVFCGFGVVARSPINQAKPRSRSLGNPEPDC